MPRYRTENAVDGEWSRWVTPVMDGYKMACCDCGLVHVLDFAVVDDRVMFRARRDNRATAAKRRASVTA